jgi:hypothetical protein
LIYHITDESALSLYYSEFYSPDADAVSKPISITGNENNKFWTWQKEWVLSYRYDITEDWLIKMGVHLINGVAQSLGDSSNQYWNLFTLKTTFVF